MKMKMITMAGGLACVFATTAMPISAEELYNAISGSGISLGINENFEPLGGVLHSTGIPLKKMGKNLTRKELQTSLTAC